jgi:hypothetical protein
VRWETAGKNCRFKFKAQKILKLKNSYDEVPMKTTQGSMLIVSKAIIMITCLFHATLVEAQVNPTRSFSNFKVHLASKSAQTDPLGGAILGVGLQFFADKLNTLINNAGTQGRLIAIEAGQQLWLTIYNAKLAYADERNKTFNQLNQTIQGNIQTLATALQTLENEGFAKSEEIIRQAQQVANTLPFGNKEPQVRGYSPYFVIASDHVEAGRGATFRTSDFVKIPPEQVTPNHPAALNATVFGPPNGQNPELTAGTYAPGVQSARLTEDPVRIEINGNFLDAAKNGYTPTLRLDGESFQPAVTTQQLIFLVPRAKLKPAPAGSLSYTTFNLVVPYHTGWWLFKKRKEATFQTLLATLPPIPGELSIEATVPTTITEWRNMIYPRNDTIKQHSNDDDLDLVHCAVPPLGGWTTEPTSVRFVEHWHQGQNPDDWRYYLQATNPQACFRVITVKRTWGTSGKVNFQIGAREFWTHEVPTPVLEKPVMKWGESKIYRFKPGEWKITFTTFDGQKQEFTNSTGPQNRFLRLSVTPTDVTIFFPRASELRW